MAVFRTDRELGITGTRTRLGPTDLLLLAACGGLAAGQFEVASKVLPPLLGLTPRLHQITRHFIWLIPLIDLVLFLGIGMALVAAAWLWPRRAHWFGPPIIIAAAVLPALALAGRKIYIEAWLLVAIGLACRISPWLERHSTLCRRWLTVSLPILLALVTLQAGSIFGGDWIKHRQENGRALPPGASPNVLLMVLDTVRADHLSLYGYDRRTSPNLDRLAKRAIRFDAARAPAPWTLPSHASLFTGRWPHELGVQWVSPLQHRFTTLAEHLGASGYATAGFVSNAGYCSYETGLGRGFTHYEDYVLEHPRSLRAARLVDAAVKTFGQLTVPLDFGWMHPVRAAVADWFFSDERKPANIISRDFLHWIDHRNQPDRPFFVFLNYLDTHTPYLLPPGAHHRFGVDPNTKTDFMQVLADWSVLDKQKLPPRYASLARDAYDNCTAYLDEQLGVLFDQLERRHLLENTLIVITSDHGESLGEHGLFTHGLSLYEPEIHVPLLILMPASHPSAAVVRQTVSLRDLPATIVDLLRLPNPCPFPGRSLARLWRDPPSAQAAPLEPDVVFSELASPNPSDPTPDRSPAFDGPLVSLADGDLIYIRNEADGREELFNRAADPNERTNLAPDRSVEPILERLRDQLRRVKPDPAARSPTL